MKHRFQITLDQSDKNSLEYPIENKIQNNELLIKSKKEIQENWEHEYNAKLENEKERIDSQYISEIDKLTNRVKELERIIEKKNKEIKTNSLKIIKLEKENENLKEVIKFYLECHLDVYHLKTWSTY